MFLIDNLSNQHTHPSHTAVEIEDVEQISMASSSSSTSPPMHSKKSVNSAVVGLVIHSAADGLALGAAGTMN
jgi:zinc transporter ZupT